MLLLIFSRVASVVAGTIFGVRASVEKTLTANAESITTASIESLTIITAQGE